MNLIVALIVAVLIGFAAYLICSLIALWPPVGFMGAVAGPVGIIVAILAFLSYWQRDSLNFPR